MEQFEKWFNKECDAGRTIYPSSYDDCSDAWKAALEWVNSHPGYDMTDVIDEELGE